MWLCWHYTKTWRTDRQTDGQRETDGRTAPSKRRIAYHRWVCWWAWTGVQFWSCRRESNCHMAKHWGCCEVEPPTELLFYVPELRLANLRTGWLLHGTEFSRLSDPECHHPGPTGRCHTASDWPSEHLCTARLAHITDVFTLPVVQEILALDWNPTVWHAHVTDPSKLRFQQERQTDRRIPTAALSRVSWHALKTVSFCFFYDSSLNGLQVHFLGYNGWLNFWLSLAFRSAIRWAKP